jgi:hypothetical protein
VPRHVIIEFFEALDVIGANLVKNCEILGLVDL